MRDADAAIRLTDYRPLDYVIDEIALDVRLDPAATRVIARSQVRRVSAGPAPLRLLGERQELISVRIGGVAVDADAMAHDAHGLTLHAPPDAFVLEIESVIAPKDNLALEGLYVSSGRFCTQCEAEGFRKFTYALDRPDSLSRYRVRIDADKASCPALLSNGNLVESGDLPDGRHYAVWSDPFPKPSYLFALVAGAYDIARDVFTTASGRKVALAVHVDAGDAPRAAYALDALKRSMRWDEIAFGREYDLDIFNIVAVRDFNFGAMENKGLNIFNAAYVLADADSATDADFEAIESIVGHEYFHNWTGNRITCRDWFQLSLKEGLTVFRDQEFSADQRSRPVQRIKDVKRLRARQFPEDAGPLAHAVRPQSYVKIDNFYTATVYEKGAEIIRMLHTLLGAGPFRAGMDLYFERHDGQAATLEDFIACFEQAAGADLSAFFRWYDQAGTPHVTARGTFDAAEKRYTLALSQSTPATQGQSEKSALPIPLRIGLIDELGAPLSVSFDGQTRDEHLVVLGSARDTIVFEEVLRRPIPALTRGFSAPIVLDDGLGVSDRFIQMAHEPDAFTRWEAGQRVMREAILAAASDVSSEAAFGAIANALAQELAQADRDPAFAALALRAPDLADLVQASDTPDPDALHGAREALRAAVEAALRDPLIKRAQAPSPTPFSPDAAQAGQRALKSVCLDLLAARGPEAGEILFSAFENATCMSEEAASLDALGQSGSDLFDAALARFFETWQERALVIDKWFAVQAGVIGSNARARIEGLRTHPLFTLRNPNRARALVMSFASRNLPAFHARDGWGYRFLAQAAGETDGFNPALAARLLTPFEGWRRFDAQRQANARAALEGLRAQAGLSSNVAEMVDRTLS
jgi:aminopeptidase N